jgi:NAD(P)-dependent dehydrogenase (short-subunit alcohol dehydrogenase family)
VHAEKWVLKQVQDDEIGEEERTSVTLAVDLSGKTILVCGCHKGGIGGATARQIALAGGAVVLLDKDQETVDAIAAEVREMGGTAHTMVADLYDVAACEQVIPRVLSQVGAFDGVANVVGGTTAQEWLPLDETPTDVFWKTMQLNFAYTFFICRDAAKWWIDNEREGAIVNVGSISAKDAAPWHGPYGAAKSGVIALTRTMANEWHEFGIRANSVSPGAVMSQRVIDKAANMSDAAKNSRAGGDTVIFSQPVELANAITFLLSDLASGISGQNLTVDRSLSTKFAGGARKSRKEMQATGDT